MKWKNKLLDVFARKTRDENAENDPPRETPQPPQEQPENDIAPELASEAKMKLSDITQLEENVYSFPGRIDHSVQSLQRQIAHLRPRYVTPEAARAELARQNAARTARIQKNAAAKEAEIIDQTGLSRAQQEQTKRFRLPEAAQSAAALPGKLADASLTPAEIAGSGAAETSAAAISMPAENVGTAPMRREINSLGAGPLPTKEPEIFQGSAEMPDAELTETETPGRAAEPSTPTQHERAAAPSAPAERRKTPAELFANLPTLNNCAMSKWTWWVLINAWVHDHGPKIIVDELSAATGKDRKVVNDYLMILDKAGAIKIDKSKDERGSRRMIISRTIELKLNGSWGTTTLFD